jgi:hypothetical protein
MTKNNHQPYDWFNQTYTEAKEVEITQLCNAVLVTNIGTTLCTVNNYPINPPLVAGTNGESWGIGDATGGVIARRQLDIAFPNGNGKVIVEQKYYIPENCD